MPKVINWVETQIHFGEDNSLVTVVKKDGFTRHWEQSEITLDGRTVKALKYETDIVRVWVHTDVVAFSGDNAVTVEEQNYKEEWYIVASQRNIRLSDGGNAVYTVEEVIEFALGKKALEWA